MKRKINRLLFVRLRYFGESSRNHIFFIGLFLGRKILSSLELRVESGGKVNLKIFGGRSWNNQMLIRKQGEGGLIMLQRVSNYDNLISTLKFNFIKIYFIFDFPHKSINFSKQFSHIYSLNNKKTFEQLPKFA